MPGSATDDHPTRDMAEGLEDEPGREGLFLILGFGKSVIVAPGIGGKNCES